MTGQGPESPVSYIGRFITGRLHFGNGRLTSEQPYEVRFEVEVHASAEGLLVILSQEVHQV